MMKLHAQLILALVSVSLLSACSRTEQLQPLSTLDFPVGFASVSASFCTSAPSPAKQKLKYLFVLDHSASNQAGFANPLNPTDVTNTDSSGARRYGPLLDFVSNLADDPNNATSFAIIDFNDDATQAGTVTGFDSNRTHFIETVTTDWIGGGTRNATAPYDSGFTNYQAALNLAKQIIQRDAQIESADPDTKVRSAYQIIFVSDGVPTVVSQSNTVYTQTFTTDLQPVIDSILKLKTDVTLGSFIASINLNTAYYSGATSVTEAITLLQQMADQGSGKFIQFGGGQNVLYQQFAPPSRMIHNQLIDVFVDNVNAVWGDDGRFYSDSDGDGLSDAYEIAHGSNRLSTDSDGNGVSDLVEYRTKGVACAAPNCAAAGRDAYAICDGLGPVRNANGTVTFPASANDGLNDCEKFLLGASRASFTSNGDFIPDQLALKNSIPFVAGTNNGPNADPFGDGVTNYEKLKQGLPLQISNKSLNFDFTARRTTLTKVSSPSPDVDCFQLNVAPVAVTSYQNNIRIMIVQNGTLIEDKPFLMNATRSLGGASSVQFVPGDFR